MPPLASGPTIVGTPSNGRAWHSLVLLLGLSASALVGVAAVQVYLRLPIATLPVLLVAASALFIYALNRLTDLDEDRSNDPRRARILRQTAVLVGVSGLTLVVAIAGLGFSGRRPTFYLVVLLTGLAYSLRLVPWYRRKEGWDWVRLKDLLVIKSVVVTAVWTASLFGTPLLHAPTPVVVPARFVVLALGFFVAYFANVVYCDMRDEPGDRAAGVRTMPVCFGPARCYRVLAAINALAVTAALTAWGRGWIDSAHLALLFSANGVYPTLIWYLRQHTRLDRDHIDYAVEALVPTFAGGLVLLRLAT